MAAGTIIKNKGGIPIFMTYPDLPDRYNLNKETQLQSFNKKLKDDCEKNGFIINDIS